MEAHPSANDYSKASPTDIPGPASAVLTLSFGIWYSRQIEEAGTKAFVRQCDVTLITARSSCGDSWLFRCRSC